MSKVQKDFFIGNFPPFKYFTNFAPFALSVIDGFYDVDLETPPVVVSRVNELLNFIESADATHHQHALINFYEYQQLWVGINFFVEYVHLNYFAGKRFSSSSYDFERLTYLKTHAKTHLHNFLLSQKVE